MEVRWSDPKHPELPEVVAEILSKGASLLGDMVRAGVVEQRFGPLDNNPLRLACAKKTGNPDFRLPTFHVLTLTLGPVIEPQPLVEFLAQVPDPDARWRTDVAYLRALLVVEEKV